MLWIPLFLAGLVVVLIDATVKIVAGVVCLVLILVVCCAMVYLVFKTPLTPVGEPLLLSEQEAELWKPLDVEHWADHITPAPGQREAT